MIVDYDDRDGGAVIALTPEEVQGIQRALAHEFFSPYGDGAVVREFLNKLMHVQQFRRTTGNKADA